MKACKGTKITLVTCASLLRKAKMHSFCSGSSLLREAKKERRKAKAGGKAKAEEASKRKNKSTQTQIKIVFISNKTRMKAVCSENCMHGLNGK